MPHQLARSSLITKLSTLATIVVLSWAGSAHADPNPYYIGAASSVGYDSNVFRLPKAVDDTLYSLGLVGGLNQSIGRQRLYANGTVSETRFAEQKQLNYTRYSFLGGIDWQTVYSLSGTLSYSSKQSLYSFGGYQHDPIHYKKPRASRRSDLHRPLWRGITALARHVAHSP